MATQKRLGRGLEALMGSNVPPADIETGEQIILADILSIDNNPNQPRQNFDDQKLEELAQSIRVHGIMQPIIVSKENGRYLIIAGERRFRAAKKAGLKEIPVIVRELEDRDKLELALIENVQREDLNPIEQARALKTLTEKYNLTQQAVSERVGKNRATIANLMRLLELPDRVKDFVENGRLSAGHARAILALNKGDRESAGLIEETAIEIIQNGWSVRETEEAVKHILNSHEGKKKPERPKPDNSGHAGEFTYAEEKLSEALNTRVSIKGTDKKGKIEIAYYTKEQLEQLYEAIVNLL